MKRASFLATVLMLVILAACAGEATPTDTPTSLPPTPTTTPSPTPSPASTPTSTPTPTLSGPSTTFGGGVWIVGVDILPGTYRNSDSTATCYWARLSGFGGGLGDTIANELSDSTQTVTINSTDAGFESNDCGTWTLAPVSGSPSPAPSPTSTPTATPPTTPSPTSTPTSTPPTTPKGPTSTPTATPSTTLSPTSTPTATPTPTPSGPSTAFGGGVWIVGVDILPGTYRNSDSAATCYWARLSGFGRGLGDTVANELSDTTQTVTISSTDAGFESNECGTWARIGN